MDNPKTHKHISILLNFLRSLALDSKKDAEMPNFEHFPDFYKHLGDELYQIATSRKYVGLLSESGINDYSGLFSEMFSKIGKKILPDIMDEEDLTKDINTYFASKNDYKWLNSLSDQSLVQVFLHIKWPTDRKGIKYIEREILNAIVILAQKIAAIGIEREVVSKISNFDDLNSPFLGLNRDVTLYVEKFLSQPNRNPAEAFNDYQHILVMLGQCKIEMAKLYKHKDKYGISLRMTVLIRKLEKYLVRLKNLIGWIQSENHEERLRISLVILKELVQTQNTKNSLKKHFSSNLEFLSFKIVENTSKSGENYIAATKAEYWKLFRMALGGGVVVAFLCWFKTEIYFFFLPAFWTAFFYSLNYALGFGLIHILKFTLATKQPAMTASTIAESLSNNGKNPDWLHNSSKLLIRQIRSQFISLVGNAVIAFPVAFIISWVYYYFTGSHIADPIKAKKLISELNIFESPAIFHASIAGVYLMLSGLISGYYENLWVYNNIHKRISQNVKLIHFFGKDKMLNFANYLQNNVGGISGSFCLGILLGSTGTLGQAFGLPIDIRHITFASGNFGIGFAGLNNELASGIVFNSLVGIALIGMANVIVSFGLSILIALSSRGTKFFEIKLLFKQLFLQFFSNGATFFYPTKSKKIGPRTGK